MKRMTSVIAAAALLGSSALTLAADTKLGLLMDITGPIASFIPPLQNAANLAVKQVNEQGGLLDGQAVAVFGDTTGSAQGAVDAAGKLVNVENVPIIMGALMSGTTIAAAEAAAIPAGVVQISPTATSPAMTGIKDNDLLYRIVPSDNYQGAVLAKMVLDEGIKKVAVTYVNNDYGVGIGQTFIDNYKKLGGEVVAEAKHEEKKDSYRSELASLAKSGAEALVVVAYAGDSGGKIVKQSIEGGLFTRFIGTDGLRDQTAPFSRAEFTEHHSGVADQAGHIQADLFARVFAAVKQHLGIQRVAELAAAHQQPPRAWIGGAGVEGEGAGVGPQEAGVVAQMG